MVAQNPSDQQDTVVLTRAEPVGPPPVMTHDTIVLLPPDREPPVAPRPVAQHPAGPPALHAPPPGGWQAVSDWRASMVPRAPVAWSDIPPFIPASRPVLVMRNNAAVVGATLGSVSLFLSLIPLVGIVAWLLAPIGLVTSAVGLLVGMTRRVGRVGALWGIATSSLALVICLAWTALLLAV